MAEDLDRQIFIAGKRELESVDYEGAMTVDDWNEFWSTFTPSDAGELADALNMVWATLPEGAAVPDGTLALAVVAFIMRQREEARKALAKRAQHADYETTPARLAKRREQARNGARQVHSLQGADVMAAAIAVDTRAAHVAEAIMDDVVQYAAAVVALPTLAKMLDRHPETLRSWRKGNSGPACVKIGGQWVYPLDSLSQWLTEQSTKGKA